MRLTDRLSKPLLEGRCPRQPAGAVLIALIIAIMLFAALGATIYSISSSGTYGSIASNLSMRAYYAAESGYRYAAGEYRHRDDIVDKMVCLDNLHGITRNLPNGLGAFSITVQPFFLITAATATAGDNYLSVKTPGEFPPGFTVPATTRISIGGAIYDAVLDAQTPPDRVDFQIPATLSENSPANAIVCLVAVTSGAQALTSGGVLILSSASGGFFPDKNARFQIGPHSHNLVFSYSGRQPNPPPGTIVLSGIQGVSDEAKTALSSPLPLNAGSNVTLKPFLQMTVTGYTADPSSLGEEDSPYVGKREITYHVPINIPESLLIDSFKDLENWEAASGDLADYVQTGQTLSTDWGVHQGGALLGGPGHAPAQVVDPQSGKNLQSIFMLLDMAPELEAIWSGNDNCLSYDIQVKHTWGSGMTHAADGICVRWNSPGIPGLYEGMGISFVCYSPPEESGGNDFIPDTIKPPGLADTPLLVLWEQKIEAGVETRRWIAYKNLGPDEYVWDTSSGAFSKMSSIFVRLIEEKDATDNKINTLQVFYGDGTNPASKPARLGIVGNDIPFDQNRWVYPPSWFSESPGILWPAHTTDGWREENDYMTWIIWDAINPGTPDYHSPDGTSIVTRNFSTPDDLFSNRSEIALHAFGNFSNTILFDDFATPILGAGQTGGFAIPLQQ